MATCTNCGTACSGTITLAVHVCTLRVNMYVTPWPFCGVACRAAWFDAATPENLCGVATFDPGAPCEDLHDQDGPTMLAVIHHEGGGERCAIAIPSAPAPSIHPGRFSEVHEFQHPHHINAWWRGDLDHAPLGSPEAP